MLGKQTLYGFKCKVSVFEQREKYGGWWGLEAEWRRAGRNPESGLPLKRQNIGGGSIRELYTGDKKDRASNTYTVLPGEQLFFSFHRAAFFYLPLAQQQTAASFADNHDFCFQSNQENG